MPARREQSMRKGGRRPKASEEGMTIPLADAISRGKLVLG
jgi:hypothetical protein